MGRRTGCYSTLSSTLTLREVAVSLILAEGTRSGANAAALPPLAVLGGVILRAAVREFSRLGYLLARKVGPQMVAPMGFDGAACLPEIDFEGAALAG